MEAARFLHRLALVATALPITARAASLDVSSPPVAVTVYSDQAIVTREGEIDIPAGDSDLVLHNLPVTVLRDSVTAEAWASAAVTLGAVETRQEGVEGAVLGQRQAELASRIRELDDQIAAVDVRAAGFKAQQDFVESLGGGLAIAAQGTAPKRPAAAVATTPETWRSAWTAIRDGVTDAAEGQRLAARDRAILVEKRAAILDRLGKPAQQSLQAVVTVHAAKPAHLRLRLSYQVPDARWYPVYEARLETLARPRLMLRRAAVVTQSTGEDWPNVTLTLSTSPASSRSAPPELEPWQIDLAPVQAPQSSAVDRVASASASAPAVMGMRSPAPALEKAMQQAGVLRAQVSETGISEEYRIASRAKIDSDGSERRVHIDDVEQGDPVLSVVAVPRVDPTAYLQARLEDRSAIAYLPGTVSLFLDGAFVGKSELPLVQPHDHAALTFGADNRVKVSYQPQGKLSSRDGIIWNTKNVETWATLITVVNHHERAMPVTILDQQPVSGDADLKVEMTADPAPSATAIDGKPGVVSWTATYQPGETREIHFGYAVSAPEGRRITGLR